MIPRAVDEVGGPTILATLTVIAALLPMAFVTGLMGPYMAPIPINSSMGMLLSLAIAFVITPWLALRLLARQHGGVHAPGQRDKVTQWLHALLHPRDDADPARSRGRRNALAVAGHRLAIALSVALVPLQAVVLKMLPFDNKSRVPGGGRCADRHGGGEDGGAAARTRRRGGEAARGGHYRPMPGWRRRSTSTAWCGSTTCAAGGEVGDLQVNLVDKAHRAPQEPRDRAGGAPGAAGDRAPHGADLKVVEVPPGRRCCRRWWPRSTARTTTSRWQARPQVRRCSSRRRTSLPSTTPRSIPSASCCAWMPPRRRLYGIPGRGGAHGAPGAGRRGHHAAARRPQQVRGAGARRAGAVAARAARRRAEAALRGQDLGGQTYEVALAELVTAVALPRERVIYRKNLQPVVYVVGDVAGGPGKTDSPLYGMFALREGIAKLARRAAAAGGVLDLAAVRTATSPSA
jgi:hypothetical protein